MRVNNRSGGHKAATVRIGSVPMDNGPAVAFLIQAGSSHDLGVPRRDHPASQSGTAVLV